MTNEAVCEVPLPSGKVWQPKHLFVKRLVQLFSIDLRSLAAFRLGLALVLICDLIVRAQDLVAHYTDFGVLPRFALLGQFLQEWLWSVHLMSGSWWWIAALFLIHGVFALMLLVGYRTRLATIVCWFLLVSLHSRNPMVLQGGDVLLRQLFFWAMFLPLGARYSVDHALGASSALPTKSIFSAASVALLIQVTLVYIFSVIHKNEQEWLWEGSALYYALAIDQFAEPLAKQLLKFPELMKWMSRFIWSLQAVGPWVVFFPFWNGPIRTGIAVLFLGFHLSMTQFLAIGPFPWISATGWLAVLPAWFWDTLAGRLRPRPVEIYYDLDCGFCRTSVSLFREFLILSQAKIAPAQGNKPIEEAMRAHNSWVIVDEQGRSHFGFAGFVALLAASPLLRPLAPVLRLSMIMKTGEWIYRRVVAARPLASRLLGHLTPAPLRLHSSLWENVLISLLLLAVMWWNLNGAYPKHFSLARPMRWLGLTLDLDQRWNMFSAPLRADGWYVIPGKLTSGQSVDVYTGRPYVTYAKPTHVRQYYPNQRWQKYMMNLYAATNRPYRLYYGQYLCRQWNDHHVGQQHLETFQVIFVQELSLPDYTSAPPKPVPVSEHYCSKG